MNSESIRQNVHMAPYIDAKVGSDITDDYSLADYYPEVRRILFVTARAIPEGKFISGNEVDCDGVVSFNITYLGEDGTITAVPITIPYTQSTSFPQADGVPTEIICTTVAQAPTCKATSPRSLSLKAHVATRILCFQNI